MANVSSIKLPNNTTYNIVDKTSGYTKNTGTITKVQTTAGAHTTIDVSSGAATFNVPTKTSHLTNDSGFITASVATATPTVDTISKFDSAAHMNSTDMTSAEVTSFVNGLNMTGSKTADYIVEQGTDGIWTYRKWQSGIAECWGAKTVTKSSEAWGSWYYIVVEGSNYPSGLFLSVTSAVGQLASGYDYVSSARNQDYGGYVLSTTTSPDILCVRPTSAGSSSVTGHWQIVGRWK